MLGFLCEIGITNALLAAVLAFFVFGVTRVWKNPHLAHFLWLLVLLKLVTPPILNLPLSVGFSWYEREVAESAPSVSNPLMPTRSPEATRVNTQPAEQLEVAPVLQSMPLGISAARNESGWQVTGERSTLTWQSYAIAAWLCGCLACGLLACVRIWQFHRELQRTAPAGESIQRVAKSVADQLGIKSYPDLRTTDGRLSPMVWPLGRPATVVLPIGLVEDLDQQQLRTIVAHEYAHVARRDCWVRWLEVLCTVLYWWHPCLWLARKEIRQAEELCCDALVMRTYSGHTHHFGEALLKVDEFLSNAAYRCPILVSEMRGAGQMKRRIEMIVNEQLPARLPRTVHIALLVSALAILPLSTRDSSGQSDKATGNSSSAAEELVNNRNRMKAISLAILNHESARGHLPAGANYDKQGKPLLSWRVHILPFLEDEGSLSLYKQFHLDEPWDSPHNRALIKKMPDAFASDAQIASKGMTSFLAVFGDGTIFPPKRGLRLHEIIDGTSNTISFVKANGASATVWTRPDDLSFADKKLLSKVVGAQTEGFLAAFVDGSNSLLSGSTDDETLRSLLNRTDGGLVTHEAGSDDGSTVVQVRTQETGGYSNQPVVRNRGALPPASGYGGGEYGGGYGGYGGGYGGYGEYGAGGEFGGAEVQHQSDLELDLTSEGTVLILGRQVPVKKLGPILAAIKDTEDESSAGAVSIKLPKSTDFRHLRELTDLCEKHGFQEIRIVSDSTKKPDGRRLMQNVAPVR